MSTMISTLFQDPIFFVVWLVVIIIALSVHEFAHAAVGHWLGDHTAKQMGRLTLNPVAHIDPIGLLALVLVGFGWGKPVPYNRYNLRDQRLGPVAIAVAGPVSNLLMAIIAAVVFRIVAPELGSENLLVLALQLFVMLNVALCLFNLIPIPPLDGSKLLLLALAGPHHARARTWIETRGSLLLIGVIVADAFFNLGLFAAFSDLIRVVVIKLLGA